MPEISIVMPVYNSEKYLESCLESIAAQTFNDFELICVNDGSTDNSLKILEEKAKNSDFTMKIITVENQGAGAARNKGFEYVTGETTIFLDSDDYFYPEFLSEMYKKYEETEADIVICKYDVVLPDGSFYAKNQGVKSERIPQKEIFNSADFPQYIFNFTSHAPWNKLFKTEFLRTNNLKFDTIPNSNDTFFTLSSLIFAEKITVIDKSLIMYNFLNANSITLNRKEKKLYAVDTFKKLKDFIIDHGKMNSLTEQSFDNAYIESLFYVSRYMPKKQLVDFLKFIKNTIPLYSKDYIYNKPYYYKLRLAQTMPVWLYIVLNELKIILQKLKRLIIKNKPKRKTSFR